MEELNLGTLSAAVLEKAAVVDPVILEKEVKTETKVDPVVVPDITGVAEAGKEEVDPKAIKKALENLEIIENKTESSNKIMGDNKGSNDDPADSVYSVLTEFLKESGVLKSSVEVKDENTFVAAVKQTIEDAKYAGLTGAQKSYMEAIEAGIPEKEAASIADILKNVGEATELELKADEVLSTAIITEDLKNQNWSDERIAKQIIRLKESKELVSEALVSKDNVVERANKFVEDRKLETKQLAEDAVKEQKDQLTKLKEAVYGYDKALSSVKVDDVLKNSVYNTMITPVGHLKDGTPVNALVKDRMENPVDFEKRLYYAYVLTNGFNDISRLQRRAENSAAKKLKEAVAGLGNVGLGSKGSGMAQTQSTVPELINL